MQRYGCKIRPFLTLPQDKTYGQVQLPEYLHRRLQLLVTVFKVGSRYFWGPLFLTVTSDHLHGALSASHARLR